MAIVKEVKINVNTTEAVKNTDKLNKEFDKTAKSSANLKDDLKGVSNVADNATGGMISKFNGLTNVISNVSKGFTTLKGAIIASGIGLLVVLIGSVISAFRASEEGQISLLN